MRRRPNEVSELRTKLHDLEELRSTAASELEGLSDLFNGFFEVSDGKRYVPAGVMQGAMMAVEAQVEAVRRLLREGK